MPRSSSRLFFCLLVLQAAGAQQQQVDVAFQINDAPGQLPQAQFQSQLAAQPAGANIVSFTYAEDTAAVAVNNCPTGYYCPLGCLPR